MGTGTKHLGSGILCRNADTSVPVPMCVAISREANTSPSPWHVLRSVDSEQELRHTLPQQIPGPVLARHSLPHMGKGTKHLGSGILCRYADTSVPVPMCVAISREANTSPSPWHVPRSVDSERELCHTSLQQISRPVFARHSLPHMGTGTLVRATPHKLPDPTCFGLMYFV